MAESCGGEESEWESLIADAQAEGTVAVAGPPNPEVSEGLPQAFAEAFGIDLEYSAGRSNVTAQKIASERQADIHSLDVFLAGGNTMSSVIYGGDWLTDLRSEAVSPDVLEPESWQGEAEGRPFVDQPDHNAVAQVSIQGQSQFIVNSELANGEINGWQDLLDPKWKGKIVAMDPTTGAGLGFNVAVMLESKLGRQFIEDLYVGQEVVLQTDDRQAADGVAKGQYVAAIGVSEANGDLAQLIADGLPVMVMASPDDAPAMVSAGYGWLGLMEPRPHAAAGKLFANWILCPDGNQVWNDLNGYESARTDVEVPDIPDYIRVDTDEEFWDTYNWELVTGDSNDEVQAFLSEVLK